MPDVPQNIPPQVMAALQQQSAGMSGGDITSILAQLAQMSPDELSAALQQLGVNIPPDQLVNAAENWLEQAAGKQAGTSDEEAAETPAPAEEEAEGETGEEARTPTPAEEEAEGETDEAELPPNAQPTGYTSPAAAQQAAPATPPTARQAAPMPISGAGRMPPAAAMRGAAAGGGSTMDDLVSAAVMQQAAGNPNATVPMPRVGRPKPPAPGLATTSLGNVRARNLSPRSRKRG